MRKDYNQYIYPYILAAIDGEPYDRELTTDKEKLQFLRDTFESEYSWSIERYGAIKAFEEWLKGLPSAINIAWTNYDILCLAREWDALPERATERQEQKILDNYWHLIAVKTFQLFNKHLD